MCGRDIIAVAKTGSGKTLAFLLPLFRHILDQPPLRDSEGPIGLIMAPARELAFQITNEAKKFTKALGLRVTCVYGGGGVADQIADLKRGAEIDEIKKILRFSLAFAFQNDSALGNRRAFFFR